MLQIDRRELNLIKLLADIKPVIRELPVGDFLCEYANAGINWIAERKTASDLAASIIDGRLFEQTARIHEAGYHQIFWFVEGDFPELFAGKQQLQWRTRFSPAARQMRGSQRHGRDRQASPAQSSR